jgi:hypothetical protein
MSVRTPTSDAGSPREMHEDTFKKLKEVLVSKSPVDETTLIVTMYRFSQVITWFGRFFRCDEESYVNLDHIRQIVDKP